MSGRLCYALKIHRKLIVPLTIFILILLTVSVLTVFSNSTNSQPKTLYQKDIKHFATSYTVAEGKLFITDYEYNLLCFDAQTGKQSWNNTGRSILTVQNSILYVGSSGGIVNTVDVHTGNLLPLQFQAIVDTSWGSKSPPTAAVIADGRLFVKQSGWRAYNVSTGKLLWESFSASHTNPINMPYTDNVWAFDGNLVLASGSYFSGNSFHSGLYRINPDTGTILWSISGFSNNQPLVYEDKIVFWNYDETTSDTGQTVISVDALTGDILWRIDLKATMYQPVIYQDHIVFVTTDGYFIAMELSGDSLVWKTPLTLDPIYLGALSVHIDSQTQSLFWGYITTIQNNEDTDNCYYDGYLYRLDLTTGNVIWASPFNADIVFFTNPSNWQPEIAILDNTVFLSTFGNLWEFSKSTGTIIGMKTFEHYMLPIASVYNKLFVVADLHVIAYSDYSGNVTTWSYLLSNVHQRFILLSVAICAIVALLILLYLKYIDKRSIV